MMSRVSLITSDDILIIICNTTVLITIIEKW